MEKKGKARSCTRRPKPSLAPIQNFYFTPKKEDTSFIMSLELMEKKVLNVITDVEEKITYLKSHPKKYYTPEPVSFKKAYLKPICMEKSKNTERCLKLSPKSIEIKAQKYRSRKSSIVKLMQSTNSFNSPKLYQEDLMHKLSKLINRQKKPCIQGIYSEILSKEGIFESYKKRTSNSSSVCPVINYSKVCNSEKSSPIPLLSHTQDTSLVLNRYNLSKPISVALSKAISLMPYLRSIHLDENGLTDLSGSEILKGIISHGMITSFYYTHNEIGPLFYAEIQCFSSNTSISELNFKGCKFVRSIIADFVWTLRFFRGLKKLSLAETSLSAVAIEKLSQVLIRSKIVFLDLSWNQIPHEASIMLFANLTKNTCLQFLDYSWNPLTDPEQTLYLCKLLRSHPTLMHVNLSHTQIPNISPYLSSLQVSEHLIGVHLTGNSIDKSELPVLLLPKLYPNSAAFLNLPARTSHTMYNLKHRDNNGRMLVAHNDSIINIDSPKKNIDKFLILEAKEVILSRVLGQSDIKASENWGVSEHCWICERWGVYQLKVTLDSLQIVATPDIFHARTVRGCKLVLKPSFNNWKDVEFEVLDEGKGEYEVSVMIPPGKHRFWIICDDKSVCVTRKISTERWNSLMVNQFTMPLRELEISLTGEMQYIVTHVFDKHKSVFRFFLEDTETIIKASFDADLKHVKVNRIIREYAEADQTILLLSKNYLKIKGIFNQLIIGPSYPCIDFQGLFDFAYTCKILDETFPPDKLNNILQIVRGELADSISTIKLKRFDFIEVLIRLALAKFSFLEVSADVKVKQFLDLIYLYFSPSNSYRFRKEKMYNLEVNEILEKNIMNLQSLLNRFKDENGRWISVNGAEMMVKSAKWNVDEENILRIFANSKMSVIDEENSETYYDKLQFVEMLEFLCRVVDKIVCEEVVLEQKLLMKLPELMEANKIKFSVKTVVGDLDND